jgi:hypothetical protein
MGVRFMGVRFMGVHHRIQPFLLSRTCVFAAFGGPGLMPHFSHPPNARGYLVDYPARGLTG